MRTPSTEIQTANLAIERALNNSQIMERGSVAQDVLGNLRNLTEHVLVYSYFGDSISQSAYYEAIQDAVSRAKRDKNLRLIWEFHDHLQKAISHYTPSETSSERLLLRYLESLYLLRRHSADNLNLNILNNLEMFPLDLDNTLQEYYSQISEKIDYFTIDSTTEFQKDRYYIRTAKPIFIDKRVYYELSFVLAMDNCSKHDRVIAFSKERIPDNYAVHLSMKSTSISICGRDVPVLIVANWRTSIRPCELNALLKILGKTPSVTSQLKSYQSLMDLLHLSGICLNELCELPDDDFIYMQSFIERSGENTAIEDLLCGCRKVLRNNLAGSNVLRYLLFKPRNKIIKDQLQERPNNWLGYLCLNNKCIPFEKNPFSSSLVKHIVSASDVVRCIDPEGCHADILAHKVFAQSEREREIYISDDKFDEYSNLDELIVLYNSSLHRRHENRKLVHESGQVFLRGNEADIEFVISKLIELSKTGVSGYSGSCQAWLSSNPSRIDDAAKESALRSMFESSKVALIYGSAGTGKTTMIDYVCSVLSGMKKCAIANTNPAVDSLRRRVHDPNCEFQTVAKYLAGDCEQDLLIVDECSTISNRDICDVFKKESYKLLLLVGDVRQIEAINLGNWFEMSRSFLPLKCIHEFEIPWRTTTDSLLNLWTSVRLIKPDIMEIMEANCISSDIDESIFEPIAYDEIVLCLNYDGLYGINNINRILQARNNTLSWHWGVHQYKVGDPILFNESNRFAPLLYNNLKGTISGINQNDNNEIIFDVAVEAPINEFTVIGYEGLTFISNIDGLATLRFSVSAIKDRDEEGSAANIVPFQVAYAVSIHKAQGLEYDSVKVVVTKDIEESISHNIFYTAITRAKKYLKIYWTPETQNHVIEALAVSSTNKDVCLLSNRCGFKMHP